MRLVSVRGDEVTEVSVERTGSGYIVRIGDREFEADLVWANEYARSLKFPDGTQFLIGHSVNGTVHEISFGNRIVHVDLRDPLAMKRHRGEGSAGGSLNAIMPGRIVRIMVRSGDEVQKGDSLLVLEAMKMENEIKAPRSGVISEIFVEQGQTVETGALLIAIA